MKRIAALVLASLLASACADPTSSSLTPADAGRPDLTPNALVVLPTCPGCVYGPVEYTRALSVRYEQITFSATAGADYVMVVTDDGSATTGVEVLLNGTQRVAKADLLGGAEDELRVPVSLLASNTLIVRMHGPIGAQATVHFERAAAPTLTIVPDPVERLPGGTQQFTVTGGSGGPYIWSVNGVDGGNATFGTITAGGFYTAPASVPTPATFQVCAREVANPAATGCASVTINPIPTAGADVVVYNDVNVFDDIALQNVDNQRMVRNLVNFTGTGPRSSGTAIIEENGHASRYTSCIGETARQTMVAEGYTFSRLSSSVIGVQPAGVKVLVLCLPTIAYSVAEINNMKAFSAQGGRIVFVGEYDSFYGSTGLATENAFLRDMGAVMRNVGNALDCGHNTLPQSSLRDHQITTGMTDVTIACASVVEPGPNDFALFYDRTNTHVLAGVAKVDVTPLPTPTARATDATSGATARSKTATERLSNDPTGKHLKRARR